MIYYCPRAYSEDCKADKCSFYATDSCIDGQLRASISSEFNGPVIACPRVNSPNCNEANCTLHGTSQCCDGLVNVEFEL